MFKGGALLEMNMEKVEDAEEIDCTAHRKHG
jgi:hypothetical protein